MGPIQSSLNNLTLSTIGAVGALGYGLKGAFKAIEPGTKPKKTSEGYTASIKKQDYSKSQQGKMNGFKAAQKATVYGNDAIYQKARATFTPAADLREARMRAAMSLSVANSTKKEQKGDKE